MCDDYLHRIKKLIDVFGGLKNYEIVEENKIKIIILTCVKGYGVVYIKKENWEKCGDLLIQFLNQESESEAY